ncbi:hypothetical protein K457DRAFT_127705 [Linnemannia elongata AG-77]|uniref:DUF2470 domain-containing protein n=1 Tax=Linnemannia elongata AG-77 TaxID=1314771 RepID=A0A197JQ05_9FUNG|nr:hypothetical protein K457DRAFT_127705 [Linnemannia elongata AG-77]
MQRRVQKDPIAEYSTRLCAYINGQPAVALSYARYFGEYPTATKATMTSIDQNGFDIVCHDQGEEHEVRVTFGHSLHAASQAKHELDTLAKEAEAALRGNTPQSQSYSLNLKTYTPTIESYARQPFSDVARSGYFGDGTTVHGIGGDLPQFLPQHN